MLRRYLVLGLVFGVLTLLAFFVTTLLSGPVGFLFSNAAGFASSRNVAQIAVLLAGAGLLVAAAVVAVPTALQPAGWGRKLVYVLPLYLLGLTLIGILLSFAGIGTIGEVIPNLMGFTLATLWTSVGAILGTIGVAGAVNRVKLSDNVLRTAMLALAVTAIPVLVAALAMLVSVVIVSTTTPRLPNFGGPGGAAGGPGGTAVVGKATTPGGQDAPTTGQAPAAGPGTGQASAPTGAPAGAQAGGQPGAAAKTGGQGAGEGRAQQGPGAPGGPGGGFAQLVNVFKIGGGLTVVLALLTLGSIWLGVRRLRSPAPTGGALMASAPPDVTLEAGRVILSGIALAVLTVGAMQLVPIARTNPPAHGTIQWDSPQTEALAKRACLDCHSSQTEWPWYASVAPASWLLASHVNTARERLNLSELDTLPPFRKSQIPNSMAMRIRNGTMPPSDYLLLHPQARLSDAEKQQLIQGLQASLSR